MPVAFCLDVSYLQHGASHRPHRLLHYVFSGLRTTPDTEEGRREGGNEEGREKKKEGERERVKKTKGRREEARGREMGGRENISLKTKVKALDRFRKDLLMRKG